MADGDSAVPGELFGLMMSQSHFSDKNPEIKNTWSF